MASTWNVLLLKQLHLLEIQLEQRLHPHLLHQPLRPYELPHLPLGLSDPVLVLPEPDHDVWASVPREDRLPLYVPRIIPALFAALRVPCEAFLRERRDSKRAHLYYYLPEPSGKLLHAPLAYPDPSVGNRCSPFGPRFPKFQRGCFRRGLSLLFDG